MIASHSLLKILPTSKQIKECYVNTEILTAADINYSGDIGQPV